MDVMGSDVSLKIRSAIKAKLVELGAYVDEELPDYIMVMVANKKTKIQMTDDLMLFLGINTDKFTTWLHEVLERLQSVTSETKKKNEGKLREKADDKLNDSLTIRGKLSKIQRNQEDKLMSRKTRDEMKMTETDENQEEVLAIKADFDADELLVEELHDDVIMPPKITKTVMKQQNIVSPMQKAEFVSQSSNTFLKTQNLLFNESSHLSKQCSKKSASSTVYPMPVKRRFPNSAVSSIVHHQLTEDDEDDDYCSPGGLASVVKVSKRRPSLPPKLQANKTLILRAMEEAKKSVIAAAHKYPVKIEPFKKTYDKSYVIRKHKINTEETQRKRLRLSELQEEAANTEFQEEIDSVILESPTELSDNVNVSPKTISPYQCAIYDERQSTECGRRIVHDSQLDECKSPNPKFIVTLDGVDPNVFLNKPKASILKGVRSQDVDESEAVITPITLDMEDAEVASYTLDDDSAQLTLLQNISRLKKKKLSERCRYWPACKNGDSCSFHHPTVQCKTFPKCKYADKCLYIHPNCRFDAICSKKDCPYTHASKRQMISRTSPLPSAKTVSSKDIKCKFFPQCTNMNCTFYHPKACRYGLSCTQHGCIYAHPPLPSRDKLKWKATDQSSISLVFLDRKKIHLH